MQNREVVSIDNRVDRPFRNIVYARTSFSHKHKAQLVWVQLADLDNSPSHFWSNFTSALSVWNLQFAQKERQIGFPSSPSDCNLFLESLHSEAHNTPLLIMFNHLHQLRQGEVYDFLDELTQSKTAELQVVLLYNEGGPQANDEGNCTDRYRYYSLDEERAYYRQCGVVLTEEQLALARDFTEGWAIAVAHFAKRLRTSNADAILQNLKAYVLSWIEHDHLRNSSDEYRTLLVRLPLLEEASLEMILSMSNMSAPEVIELINNSPFIRYRHETDRFYCSRYFRCFLEREQALLSAEQKRQVYIRAGDWHREQGEKREAIACYRKAGDYQNMLVTMTQWNAQYTLDLAECYIDAINSMPDEFVEHHPLLRILYCHMLSTRYDYKEVELRMAEFCNRYDKGDATSSADRPLVGEAYFIWANAATYLQRGYEEIYALYKKANDYLPNGSATYNRRMHTYADTPAITLHSPKPGALQDSLKALRRIIPLISKVTDGACHGVEHLAEAEMNFYIRDFKNVEQPAHTAIQMGLEKEQCDIVCSAYYLLMRYFFAKGLYREVRHCLDELRNHAKNAKYDDFFSMPDVAEIWLDFKLGRVYNIPNWVRNDTVNRKVVPPRHVGRDRLMRACYLLFNQEYAELIPFLDSSIETLRKRGRNLLMVQLIITKAVALCCFGQSGQSVRALEEAYGWTAANRIVMPYAEFGSYMRPLIENCRREEHCSIPDDWLDEIAKKADTYNRYQYRIRKEHEESLAAPLSPLEKLTVKELKTLLLLSRGLQRSQIADQQQVSVNSVKNMLRRIYTKIGASGHADAVRIATEHHIEALLSGTHVQNR